MSQRKASTRRSEHDTGTDHRALRVLLAVSGTSKDLVPLTEAVRDKFGCYTELSFLRNPGRSSVHELLEAQGEEILVLPRGLLRFVSAIRKLRQRSFDRVVLLESGPQRSLRLRVAARLAGTTEAWLSDGSGNLRILQPLSVIGVLWDSTWSRVAHFRHLAASAFRLIRQQGLSAMLSRAGIRIRSLPRSAYRYRLMLLTFGMWRTRIRFQRASEPRISIVIHGRDCWKVTYQCLWSIVKYSAEIPCEVILVTDASTVRKAPTNIENLRVLRCQEDLSIAGGFNLGAQAASGRYVLFLTSDMVLTEGCLDALVQFLDRKATCDAVGAKVVNADGTLDEAGGIVWRSGSGFKYGRYDDPECPQYNYLREVDFCSVGALLARRERFVEVGGLDEQYSRGYWSDADLCFKLRATGGSVWFQPASVFVHAQKEVAGIDDSCQKTGADERDSARFTKRWKDALITQWPLDAENVFMARDRNHGPVAVVFDHFVPTFDRDAGSALMYSLLVTLKELGYRVLFWPHNRFRTPVYTDALQDQGIEVLYGADSLTGFLRTHGRFLDLAIVHRAEVAEEYLPIVQNYVSATAYIAADLEHVREARRLAIHGGDCTSLDTLQDREERIIQLADRVACHSPQEIKILESQFGVNSVHWLPLPIAEAELTTRTFEERENMIFVGSTHPPNVDAIRYFVRDIWPSIQGMLPAAELWVVGDVAEVVSDLEKSIGVKLVGHVKNLSDWLNRARVFVAPLRYGAGIKGKILDALNHGLPVVTTSIGAEGIGLKNGESALIADSDDEFVAAAVEAYTSPDRWLELRKKGRDLVVDSFSQADFRQAVRELVSSLPVEDRD